LLNHSTILFSPMVNARHAITAIDPQSITKGIARSAIKPEAPGIHPAFLISASDQPIARAAMKTVNLKTIMREAVPPATALAPGRLPGLITSLPTL